MNKVASTEQESTVDELNEDTETTIAPSNGCVSPNQFQI
jgi:hypothetical protein